MVPLLVSIVAVLATRTSEREAEQSNRMTPGARRRRGLGRRRGSGAARPPAARQKHRPRPRYGDRCRAIRAADVRPLGGLAAPAITLEALQRRRGPKLSGS